MVPSAVSAGVFASVLPLRDWSRPAFVALLAAAGVAGILVAVRAVSPSGLPPWSLEIDVGLGNLLVTVAAAVGHPSHVHMGNLYLPFIVLSVLYLPVRPVLVHFGLAGVAYAVVLAVTPDVEDPPVLEWLSVFGTALVVAAVVYGLVSALRAAALKDSLTGLANRRSWDERFDEEMRRAQRTRAALSVALIDLDGFKAVNDRDGHDAGDRLLQALAQAWKAVFRGGGDFLARVGGDEFAIIAPGSDTIGIDHLVERLRDVSPKGVSWSVGIATWDGLEHAGDLFRRADAMMYEMKQRRRQGNEVGSFRRGQSSSGTPNLAVDTKPAENERK
jgi:diguanylate cyclase (GGDEF)-like protein